MLKKMLHGSLLVLTFALAACGDHPATPSTPTTPTPTQAAPTVTGVEPTAASADGGASVVITGTGFTNVSGVLFGTTTAPLFTVDSDTSITVTSPGGAVGSVPVFVTTAGGTSVADAGVQFSWLPNPLLALSFDAASVQAGQRLWGSVTVTYPAPTGGIRLPLASPSRSSAVLIPLNVQVPAGETTGTFQITTFYQSSPQQILVVTDHGGQSKSATATIQP